MALKTEHISLLNELHERKTMSRDAIREFMHGNMLNTLIEDDYVKTVRYADGEHIQLTNKGIHVINGMLY